MSIKTSLESYHNRTRANLIAGKVEEHHFYLLVDIVGVKNQKMVHALREILVCGTARKVACEMHGVPQSYLSIKRRQLQGTSLLVSSASIYYLCADRS
ncbi:MAG: PapB/FocB family fimbrial expression transcriptional regulator [Acinetobacter sp.]